ncbi:acyl transferase [Ichthyenterobacterium sp. W332]|uniref:Acyl transferase n=1 Tax=Microcosmobacter mediterraneus TaxID=3075607 RepID=A0ABU2YKC6_9FLAO|nr:acyl transferase [Ichthyenterobacterium sp. W332]MDT0558622.1 acyl transferase [Ichthyenterobacterium sp. W332]
MDLKEAIFKIKTKEDFESLALSVFKFQYKNNVVYRSFCDLLYKNPSDIRRLEDIPFLPIQFFKSHKVLTANNNIEQIFTSSGTTGNITSKHHITDIEIYKKSFRNGFIQHYGAIEDYAILALLPSYLERKGSSLIYMAEDFITQSKHKESGFYLNDFEQLSETLQKLEDQKQKTLLLGVSFALLGLIEYRTFKLKHTIVMETGGMKGRRKEIIRQELHRILKNGFGVSKIHSEYGMTELLSQAYSQGDGIFKCSKWMKVLTRNTEDPLSIQSSNKTGGLNIIDLANLNSCSFIATQDLGSVYDDGTFEVIGRFDNSDIRGCNLMVL